MCNVHLKLKVEKNIHRDCYRVVVLVSSFFSLCFCWFFFLRLSLVFVSYFLFARVHLSLFCYNLSRMHSECKRTKKTCPRNVSISVKLIFWNLCYTSIKLIPSHIPLLCYFFVFFVRFFKHFTWMGARVYSIDEVKLSCGIFVCVFFF